MDTTQKVKKTQLEREFDELRKGTSNVPALLQKSPQATLESLNLEKYEIFLTEPLHDLKGHIHNIFEGSLKRAMGETRKILEGIQATVLSKATLRCSDYRKALIIITKFLKECNNPDREILKLFHTATEISEIMYAPDSKRAILRLHNLTYIHGKVCVDLFSHTSTQNAVYGRYFHSISVFLNVSLIPPQLLPLLYLGHSVTYSSASTTSLSSSITLSAPTTSAVSLSSSFSTSIPSTVTLSPIHSPTINTKPWCRTPSPLPPPIPYTYTCKPP